MFAKRFFYVSAAMLCLALTYHLGARSAGAQAPSNPIVGVCQLSHFCVAIAANGDFYIQQAGVGWRLDSNVFSGATPVEGVPFGQLEVK